jgi:uncharacterized protein with ParB-like and HNH nuclease domain
VKEIIGTAKTVRELLKGVRYSIDYYQREYRWQDKQVRELVDDLTGKFLENYQSGHARNEVEKYSHYFLGSIIISERDLEKFIVDGQQRLTTLTLLLILLRILQQGRLDSVNVDELIVSEKYGQKSFNLAVDDRAACMDTLYDGQPFDTNGDSESITNLYGAYQTIQGAFPDELKGDALPYFVDWLQENVHLVEITAYSDKDAYAIFETMNDRGLSLTPTDMLKGYLLTNLDGQRRQEANKRWRDRIQNLRGVGKDTDTGKDVDAEFFKAWLRSQYATKIRERKKNADPEDFDLIGTEFHRWVRDSRESIGLIHSDDFYRFIERDFDFYSQQYLSLLSASQRPIEGLEHIFYNARQGFTLQYMLLLAPLATTDSEEIIRLKLRLVARFIDIRLTWRQWNFRSIAYSTMQYAMFLVMRDIRRLDPQPLAQKLYDLLSGEAENFETNLRLRIHQQNGPALHLLLARLTDYVETQSGQPSHYVDYVTTGRMRYEVEHIWANHAEQHTDEFDQPADFEEYRSRIGGLLLLQKSPNASLGDMPYTAKLDYYNSQNLLARSLHCLCYEHNPGFLGFIERSGLPFRAMPEFTKAEIDERGDLYRRLAKMIWNPEDLLREVAG